MLSALVLIGAFTAVAYAQPPQWTQAECGKSKYADAGDMNLPSGFIVGGQQARPYEFPWQASIRRKATNSHFCGGIIISERWVLTAAHCMDGETAALVSVVVGDWQRTAESTVRQTLNVESFFVHELYNTRTSENDISVIKLASDIAFSEDVAPVCAGDSANDYVYYKSQCAGWGSLVSGGVCCPDILRYVTLNITTNTFCNNVYGIRGRITEDMICASDNTGGNDRDSCQGDSGGPLTIKEADGTFRIVGVVSWGIGCASGYPGVYARAAYFNNWITDKITNN
jgi:secreted trypsin-like serine protease